MRCGGLEVISSRRSSDKLMCVPRFVAATAWISSTITVSTLRSVSRACDVSIRYSDSGVVMRMSGGSRKQLLSFLRMGVAGTDRDRWFVDVETQSFRGEADPEDRSAEVLLDVDGESAQR